MNLKVVNYIMKLIDTSEERIAQFYRQQSQYEGFDSISNGLDFNQFCFLRKYMEPLEAGGMRVRPYLTCVSDGTVKALGEGFELPCERLYPGNAPDRLWRVGWANVGGYPIHTVWQQSIVDGQVFQRLGDVNSDTDTKKLWEEDKEKVLSLYNAAQANSNTPNDTLSRYRQILPQIVLIRHNGEEECHENVSYELLGFGDVASIKILLPTGEALKAFHHVCDDITSSYGRPVMKEYIRSRGTYVGGSVGAGGGFLAY